MRSRGRRRSASSPRWPHTRRATGAERATVASGRTHQGLSGTPRWLGRRGVPGRVIHLAGAGYRDGVVHHSQAPQVPDQHGIVLRAAGIPGRRIGQGWHPCHTVSGLLSAPSTCRERAAVDGSIPASTSQARTFPTRRTIGPNSQACAPDGGRTVGSTLIVGAGPETAVNSVFGDSMVGGGGSDINCRYRPCRDRPRLGRHADALPR